MMLNDAMSIVRCYVSRRTDARLWYVDLAQLRGRIQLMNFLITHIEHKNLNRLWIALKVFHARVMNFVNYGPHIDAGEYAYAVFSSMVVDG